MPRPGTHYAPKGSTDRGSWASSRWDDPCYGDIHSVFTRKDKRWRRVGAVCLRCFVIWPDETLQQEENR